MIWRAQHVSEALPFSSADQALRGFNMPDRVLANDSYVRRAA